MNKNDVKINKIVIGRFMEQEVGKHLDKRGDVNSTSLAEAASNEYHLAYDEDSIPEAVYDLAVEVANKFEYKQALDQSAHA